MLKLKEVIEILLRRKKKKKFKELFDKFDLASAWWQEFDFKLEEAPLWCDYDFGFIIYCERDNYFYFFLACKISIFSVFEDYAPANIQTFLACVNKWFKIYALTKEPINLLHELKVLNDLLSEHLGSNMENFQCVLMTCLNAFLFFCSRKKGEN